MAKDWRTIKLSYNTTVTQMEVFTEAENVKRIDFSSFRRTLDGTGYKQRISTNVKYEYSYQFNYVNQEVYDFFYDAYEAELSGLELTFDWELDDGTFRSVDCTISLPQWGDENISDTIKVYNNFGVTITEL